MKHEKWIFENLKVQTWKSTIGNSNLIETENWKFKLKFKNWKFENSKFKIWNSNFKLESSKSTIANRNLKVENRLNQTLKTENWNWKFEIWKLQTKTWRLNIANCKLKLCVEIPSNCGLPLWPPIVGGHGNTAQNCSYQFAYVFSREATGGHSWRPWEYHSQLLLINFPMFSYGRPWEAMGGHGNTEIRTTLI